MARRPQIEHSEIEADAPSRIVIVADSHSRPHPSALEWIARERPAHILHAGDIGDLSVLDALAEVAPVSAVRGNIDDRGPRIPDHRIIDVRTADQTLRVLLTHIAVYGPSLRRDARALAEREGAQVVVCGHSHIPLIAGTNRCAVFNPGSFGPRRFHLPITFGVMDLASTGASFRHVDCTTGDAWTPPEPIGARA